MNTTKDILTVMEHHKNNTIQIETWLKFEDGEMNVITIITPDISARNENMVVSEKLRMPYDQNIPDIIKDHVKNIMVHIHHKIQDEKEKLNHLK